MTTAGRLRTVVWAAVLAVAVAGIGGALTELGPWYYGLRKPAFQPPDWAFGPAWTLIFSLTALAGVVAWTRTRDARTRRSILLLFGLNVALNILWSALFFKLHRPDWALFEVWLLWASIAALIWSLWNRAQVASVLLVPYLCWVTFAAILNMAVVQLNGPFGG